MIDIINIKSGEFFKILDFIFLLFEVEEVNDQYAIVTYKSMSNGILRREPFLFTDIEKLSVEKYNLIFKKELKNNYKFVDKEGNSILIKKKFLKNEIERIRKHQKLKVIHRCNPVYINCNNETAKINTLIELKTKTEDANIYYTLDGINPSKNGILYKQPIKLEKKMILKAYASNNKIKNSVVSTYKFNLESKRIKIFLSPSKQNSNLGIEASKYTNEMDIMNKVADVVEKKLRENGFIIIRNNPKAWIRVWLRQGRKNNVDLHLAIHSNASTNHNKKGVETWVHDEDSNTYSLATLIEDNLYNLYYDNKDPITYRGVRYAKGRMIEVNPKHVKFGILIEVAYHDNLEDANWIVDNIKNIGNNIADSIITYYQIK